MFRTVMIAACVFGSLASAPLSAVEAQEQCPAEQCYAQEDAREDLRVLYERLQAEHVDLFARRSQAEYDARFRTLRDAIEGPVPRERFHLILQELLAFGKVGHATTNAPINDVIAKVQNGGTIIPLSITFRDGAMVTDQWAAEGDALPPGSRITWLGGLDMPQFEARVAKILSADTPRLMHAKLGLGFPVYLALMFGDLDAIEVGYVAPDGSSGETSVPAVGFNQMYALHDARPVPAPPGDPSPRFFEDLGEGVFYLKPGPFSALESEKAEGEGAYAIAGFETFVEEAFAAIEASGASDLLIDLRGNPGGDASFSDLIVSRIADQPYRQSSRYVVRAGENTRAAWADREPAGDEGLGDRIASALADAETGAVLEIDVPQIAPRSEGRFDGRVWALIDRYSFSNAAVVAAVLQNHGLATLIGEETADLATTYGAVESFTLPHSQAVIEYPKAYMIRPSGDESIRGVVPEIALEPRAIGEAEDRMLRSAIAAITAAR